MKNLRIKYIGEESLGEKSVGEKYVGEKLVGQKYTGETGMGEKSEGAKSVGEKSVGEKNVGEKCIGESSWVKNIPGGSKVCKISVLVFNSAFYHLKAENIALERFLVYSGICNFQHI